MSGAHVRLGMAAIADAVALTAARPDTALLRDLAAPHAWVARVGADAAAARLAGAALWLTAVWVAVGLLGVIAARVPGSTGRLAARVAAVTLPRTLLRLVAGAAGLGVVIAPVTAGAASPPRAPAWPTSAAPSAPAWPTAPGVSAVPAGPTPPERPANHSAIHPDGGAARHRTAPRQVRVRPGDSLWAIAADHLPPDRRDPARVAASWPRWYAANRRLIGADPDRIEVGQHLHPPTTPRTEPGR